MIRVAIVEDDSAERERLRACLRWLEESEGMRFHVAEFASGTAFIGSFQPVYDLILKIFFVQFFCVFLPPLLNIFCFC